MNAETQNALIYIGLTLVAGLIFLALLLRAMATWGKKLKLPAIALNPIRLVLKWTGVFIILAICLDRVGFDLGKYVLSVLGLIAIGFVAVWSVLSNISCTFILIILQPFRVNDLMEFPGEEIKGRVVDVNLVYTTLKADDGSEFRIPNNHFFQKTIKLLPGDGKVSLGEQLYEEKPAK